MTGPWQSTPDPDRDHAPCDHCGTDVLLEADGVCPHGYVACHGCGWPAVCFDCRRQAVRDMFTSGDYNPRADALYDHTAKPEVPHNPWFDPSTNSYRRPS